MDAIVIDIFGFAIVSVICIGILIAIVYLIRESKVITKKVDAVTQKLIDIKYR